MKLEKIIILQGFVRRLEREEFYAKAYFTDREVLHSYLPRNHRDIALAKRAPEAAVAGTDQQAEGHHQTTDQAESP